MSHDNIYLLPKAILSQFIALDSIKKAKKQFKFVLFFQHILMSNSYTMNGKYKLNVQNLAFGVSVFQIHLARLVASAKCLKSRLFENLTLSWCPKSGFVEILDICCNAF